MMKKLLTILLIIFTMNSQAKGIEPVNYTYIQIDSSRAKWGDFDEPEWLRYFGLSFQDVNHDALIDIVSGRYLYLNPGGEMLGPWKRIDFGFNVDAMVSVNVDDDDCADVVAQALPDVYWLEADDRMGKSWKVKIIAQLPKTGHNNGQGYRVADVFKGGKPEILLTANGGVYALIIPYDSNTATWEVVHVVKTNSDEGFDCADMDGDGDLDIVAGKSDTDGEHADILSWYENPGTISEEWKDHFIGNTVNAIDRVNVADLNGDGLFDVGVAEEQYPPQGPTAYLFWFEQKENGWVRHTVVQQYSLHNLDIADMDEDGDKDLITSEHQGSELKMQIWENDGEGNFVEHLIDRGKESHLGTQVCDLDRDGDLDIISIAWNNYKDLHLWRNDAIRFTKRIPSWHQVSNINFDFPISKAGRQVATLVMDIDKDGITDFVIASYTGMEWYKMKGEGNAWSKNPEIGWDRYVIDHGYDVHIEAGGDYYDIDDDGDLDIVMGGSGQSNQVWWWENPYPAFKKGEPWKRYLIKNEGEYQQHDQIMGDFDGDGQSELVFWNQGGRTLFRATVPKKPEKYKAWKLEEIFTWDQDKNYEGLAKADIDEDGLIDLVGGGLWFKYKGNGEFEPKLIDDYSVSRSVVGDFIEGGRVEILIGSGDQVGPLNLYHWKNGTWNKRILIERVDHGHTLQTGDLNDDGHLDIYTAEMHTPGAGIIAKQWVLYGDGEGHFKFQLISTGTGTHEGRIADLDGDGDLDILQKDFNHQRRIDVWLNNGMGVKQGEVRITSTFYKGSPHFKIVTLNAIYYLEKSSGGFSSIYDKNGNDWVGFSKIHNNRFPVSASADYRGIPNMIYNQDQDSGTGHPGFNTIKSYKITTENSIRFESNNGFIFSWVFEDDHVILDVEEVIPDQTYWILYEGPIAGDYYTCSKYWGTDKGMKKDIPDYLHGKAVEDSWQWIYFGDKNVDRVFYIAQYKPDNLSDLFGFMGASEDGLHADDGMVVFGFGRNKETQSLLRNPNKFYFGFHENKIDSMKRYKILNNYLDFLLK